MLSFMQHCYVQLGESQERFKSLYSYAHRMERLKDILQNDPKCRIAIYGTGATANKMIGELRDSLDNIIGVYDGIMKKGEVVGFDVCQKRVLEINDVHRDDIQYIALGSEKEDVIDTLRKRIKYLEEEGIGII